MEEQKNEMQGNPEATEGTEQKSEVSEKPQKEQAKGLPTRSYMLMCLGGIYLLYTGYKLCKNVLDGVEGASWGFFAAGIVFAVIGGGMLFFGVRDVLRRDKALKVEEDDRKAASEQAVHTPPETVPENTPSESSKGMSIAERAKLAGRLSEDKKAEDGETAE